MSTAQDIWETYRDEIAGKTRLVYRKRGPMAFCGDGDLRIKSFYEGVVLDVDVLDGHHLLDELIRYSIVDSPALSKAIDGDSR